MIPPGRKGTTPRNYFYKHEKKVPADHRLYLTRKTALRHIALLCDAVCLDRVSVGFIPSVDGKFIGPIEIRRPESPQSRQVIDYGQVHSEPGHIGPEWLQVYNGVIPLRTLTVGNDFKGIVLFEEEGECVLFAFCDIMPKAYLLSTVSKDHSSTFMKS